MKRMTLLTICLAVFGSCDIFKEDASPVVRFKTEYIPNEPTLIDLSAYLDHGNAKSFEITRTVAAGEATIIGTNFLLYSPSGGSTDNLQVDFFDQHGEKLGESIITLQGNPDACGVAKVDRIKISHDEVLQLTLTSNDQLCDPIHSIYFQTTPLENGDGLLFSIQKDDPLDAIEPLRIRMTYQAPAGFTGVVRAVYVAMVNVKDEYRDLPFDELLIFPAEKFQHYTASLVEIEVE